jgi:hypothetical protein
MRKAIAIAATQKNPFQAAFTSASNALHLMLDFMYGTPERVRFTYMFAFALAMLGGVINETQNTLFCAP